MDGCRNGRECNSLRRSHGLRRTAFQPAWARAAQSLRGALLRRSRASGHPQRDPPGACRRLDAHRYDAHAGFDRRLPRHRESFRCNRTRLELLAHEPDEQHQRNSHSDRDQCGLRADALAAALRHLRRLPSDSVSACGHHPRRISGAGTGGVPRAHGQPAQVLLLWRASRGRHGGRGDSCASLRLRRPHSHCERRPRPDDYADRHAVVGERTLSGGRELAPVDASQPPHAARPTSQRAASRRCRALGRRLRRRLLLVSCRCRGERLRLWPHPAALHEHDLPVRAGRLEPRAP